MTDKQVETYGMVIAWIIVALMIFRAISVTEATPLDIQIRLNALIFLTSLFCTVLCLKNHWIVFTIYGIITLSVMATVIDLFIKLINNV